MRNVANDNDGSRRQHSKQPEDGNNDDGDAGVMNHDKDSTLAQQSAKTPLSLTIQTKAGHGESI